MIPWWRSRAGLWTREDTRRSNFTAGTEASLPCRMTRGRRPDVVERRNLDDGYKEQEIGFRISTTVEETGGKKAVLKFLGSFGEQTYEIDIQELRKEKKKKGLPGRFRKGGAEDGQDYEEWRKTAPAGIFHIVEREKDRISLHAAGKPSSSPFTVRPFPI